MSTVKFASKRPQRANADESAKDTAPKNRIRQENDPVLRPGGGLPVAAD